MRVLVMGAGAVGGYYGSVLAQRGHVVTFVARGAHLAAMRERGLTVHSGGRTTVLHPAAAVASAAEVRTDVDLVLFTVKGYDTEAAAAALQPVIGPTTAVLTLQNGVESVEQLGAILGPAHVLAGTTTIETTIAGPGVIDQTSPTRRIVFGEPSGEVTARVEAIATALRDTGVEVVVATDARRAVWEKFVRLASMASVTSACQATIGEIRETSEGGSLCRTLISEAVAVGRAWGVALPADAVDAAVAFIENLPRAMKTSMQRDYERRRRVELEQLPGAVVRLGRERGVPTPAFDLLYAILKVRALTFGGLAQPIGPGNAGTGRTATCR